MSVTELISGMTVTNSNVSANMIHSRFFVCPVCGNIIHTMESLKIFALDLPEILEDKLKRIEKANLNSTAVYVPCNLANVSWKEKLLKAGYNKQCKTFGSLLGISYHLNKEDFKSLIKNISEVMSEGATICFDYPSINESRETKTN